MIIVFHLSPLSSLALPAQLTFVKNYFGLGVGLFFVISGFSLTYSNYDRALQSNWTRSYLIKRFFRIAPLFYFMILITSIFLYTRGALDVNLFVYLLNFTFMFNFVPGFHESIVFAGWTIGVEMIFYALLPAVLLSIRTLVAAACLYILCVGVSWASYQCMSTAGGLPAGYAHLSFVSNTEFFAAGILGFFIFDLVSKKRWENRYFTIACFVLSSTTLGLAIVTWSGLDLLARRSLWAIAFMILCVWQSRAPSAILAGKVMGYMGERSYSMYLLHPLTIILLSSAVLALSEHFERALGGAMTYVLCAIFVITVVALISEVTYRLIESPFIRLASSSTRRAVAATNTI